MARTYLNNVLWLICLPARQSSSSTGRLHPRSYLVLSCCVRQRRNGGKLESRLWRWRSDVEERHRGSFTNGSSRKWLQNLVEQGGPAYRSFWMCGGLHTRMVMPSQLPPWWKTIAYPIYDIIRPSWLQSSHILWKVLDTSWLITSWSGGYMDPEPIWTNAYLFAVLTGIDLIFQKQQ